MKSIIDCFYLIKKVFDASGFPIIASSHLLTAKANERETPYSLFERCLLKAEIWRATVMYSPQDSVSSTAVVEVTGRHSNLLKVPGGQTEKLG